MTRLFFVIKVLFLVGNGMAFAQPPYFPDGVPVIRANPPGPWLPCMEVFFQVEVNNYQWLFIADGDTNTQYFHGLGIKAGECWQKLEFDPPPPAIEPTGTWLFLNPGPRPLNQGEALPGYYFDGIWGYSLFPVGFLDGDPSNNWGDGGSGTNIFTEGGNTGPWRFSWRAKVPCDIAANSCDLTMSIRITGDGETGSYEKLPPAPYQNGQPIIQTPNARLKKSNLQRISGNSCKDSVLVFGCLEGCERIVWQVTGTPTVLEELPPNGTQIRVVWPQAGSYIVRILDASVTPPYSLEEMRVTIEQVRDSVRLASYSVCLYEADTLTAFATGLGQGQWILPSSIIPLNGQRRDDTLLLKVNAPGTHIIRHIRTTPEGCSMTTTRGLVAYDLPTLTPRLDSVWSGSCDTAAYRFTHLEVPATFTRLEYNNRTYFWGDTIRVLAGRPAELTMQIRRPDCSVTTTKTVNPPQYRPLPSVRAKPRKDSLFVGDYAEFEDQSRFFNQRTWLLNGQSVGTAANHRYVFKHPGNYQLALRLQGLNGCDTVYIFERLSVFPQANVTVPNVITPNGDMVNDNLVIIGPDTFEYELVLYDRFGNVALTASGSTVNQPATTLTTGVYFYTLNITNNLGESIKKTGNITVLR